MQWYFEIDNTFCSTLFTYNGSLTTKVHHMQKKSNGVTTILHWGDVFTHETEFTKDEEGYNRWVDWCNEYASSFAEAM